MPGWPHTARSLPAIALFVGLLSGLLCIGLRHAGSLQPLELACYDWLLRARPASERPDPRIVLITITEEDIQNQGRWPISDATLAKALERLLHAGPRVIGIDIYRDHPVNPGHEKLGALLSRRPEIIGLMYVGGERKPMIPPPPALRETTRFGFSDILVDDDHIVRLGLLSMDAENPPSFLIRDDNCEVRKDRQNRMYCTVRSFALQVADRYLRAEGVMPQSDPAVPAHLWLERTALVPFEATDGGYAGADTRGYQILLDYRTAHAKPATFTLSELLAGQVPPQAVHGKIVLIGMEAESIEKYFFTPFMGSDGKISGVHLHAQLVNQLLRAALDGQAPTVTTVEWQETAGTLLWGLLGGVVGLWVRSPWRFVAVASGGVSVLGAAAWLALLQGFWIPIAQPALAWLVSSSITTAAGLNHERRERGRLMQLFAQHVSPEVAEDIWHQRDQFLDGQRPRPQKMTATVLFSDLQGYTSVAAGMEPQELMDWVNSYVAALTDVIITHHGIIDDYAGDGIKANFGVPLPRAAPEDIQDDACRAVRCALAMQGVLERLNAQSQARGLPTVGMRIGICTGPVVAGSLGSAQRLKYTTVGDTVNSAARLESLDKDRVTQPDSNGLCRILIGDTTAGYVVDRFRMERLGEVAVKGKERPLIVYRVVGPSETADRQP